MALGAGRGEVLSLVLRMGMKLVLAGVATGLAASVATNRLMTAELWNVSLRPGHAGRRGRGHRGGRLAACYVPAARALRVDPMAALRLE